VSSLFEKTSGNYSPRRRHLKRIVLPRLLRLLSCSTISRQGPTRHDLWHLPTPLGYPILFGLWFLNRRNESHMCCIAFHMNLETSSSIRLLVVFYCRTVRSWVLNPKPSYKDTYIHTRPAAIARIWRSLPFPAKFQHSQRCPCTPQPSEWKILSLRPSRT
jgi:hypothetical protein